MKKMVIFHSYVKLPEGILICIWLYLCSTWQTRLGLETNFEDIASRQHRSAGIGWDDTSSDTIYALVTIWVCQNGILNGNMMINLSNYMLIFRQTLDKPYFGFWRCQQFT